jgi:serine/threonine protein kinase
LKRDVAIKVLPAGLARDPDRITRFEREARAAGTLNHPNIVAVYDIGRDDDTYWIAAELVAGESLAKVVERGPLAAPKTLEIATQIADGLAAAHAAGIVHRDIKPANIMVTRDGLPITAMGSGRDGRLIRRWHRRSCILPRVTAGALISIWRNSSIGSITTI